MRGDVLDGFELEPGGLDLVDQRADVRLFPAMICAAKRSRSSVSSWNWPTATRIPIVFSLLLKGAASVRP
jgi:hypothetical protein